jgi:hypothetical protein
MYGLHVLPKSPLVSAAIDRSISLMAMPLEITSSAALFLSAAVPVQSAVGVGVYVVEHCRSFFCKINEQYVRVFF